jgi:hypothetical protein
MLLLGPGSSVRYAMSATETPPEECSRFVQVTEVYCTNLARSPITWWL